MKPAIISVPSKTKKIAYYLADNNPKYPEFPKNPDIINLAVAKKRSEKETTLRKRDKPLDDIYDLY